MITTLCSKKCLSKGKFLGYDFCNKGQQLKNVHTLTYHIPFKINFISIVKNMQRGQVREINSIIYHFVFNCTLRDPKAIFGKSYIV